MFYSFCLYVGLICSLPLSERSQTCVSFVTTTIEVLKMQMAYCCPFYNMITSLTHYYTKV